MSKKRHIIVTGGSRGLGLAMIKQLISDNYVVSTCSRSQSGELSQLIEGNADKIFWQQVDIGDEGDCENFINAAMTWAGDNVFYGLINNAGIAKEGILATFPNVETEKIIQTNLIGAIQMARLALRKLLAQNSAGRIINISSIIGIRGYTGLSAYSASKAGLDGFTRSLAREVGSRNITVNSVSPGYLTTDMSSTLSKKQQQQIIGRTPLGRLGRPDDIIPTVQFLLSDGANFITGQCITIDGGITC
jgi:3-oxoacyl-[acyl-carrier protein] reductase